MLPLRLFRLLVLGTLCLVALPASSALAARRATPRPTISSVGPLELAIGDTLTIRGRNFLSGSRHNTVIFKHEGSPAVSVKAGRATRTRMTVVLPASLAKSLPMVDGEAQPMRFQVRVRAHGLSKGSSELKRSALIGPADDSADGLDAAGGGDCGAADGVDDSAGTDLPDTTPDDVVSPDPCADDGGDGTSAGDGADAADVRPGAPGAPGGAGAPGSGGAPGGSGAPGAALDMWSQLFAALTGNPTGG